MKHIADVNQIARCPSIWRAVCRCGEWQYESKDTTELQRIFNAHKAQPFLSPDYRDLTKLYFQAEISFMLEHHCGDDFKDRASWLLEKCNTWLAQEGYLPFTLEEIEGWLP